MLFSLLNSNAIYAQFYDDDDEIYFYQRVNGNDNDSKVAENGAYPPNQNGLIHPQLSLKWA